MRHSSILSKTPFGSSISEMSYSTDTLGGYRYGFNNQEKDDEVVGKGDFYAFEYRIEDARLGRFLSIDPLSKKFPFYSPYQFASNSPIIARELEGLESELTLNTSEKKDAWSAGSSSTTTADNTSSSIAPTAPKAPATTINVTNKSEVCLNTDIIPASIDPIVNYSTQSQADGLPFKSSELTDKYKASINTFLRDKTPIFQEILQTGINSSTSPTATLTEIGSLAAQIVGDELLKQNWNSILVDEFPDLKRPDPKKGTTILLTNIELVHIEDVTDPAKGINKTLPGFDNNKAPLNQQDPEYSQFRVMNYLELSFTDPVSGKVYNFNFSFFNFTIYPNQ